MSTRSELLVRIATQAWEFEQIHALNHRTFAEEIPRYAANAERRLVDRFHDENTYVVALRGRTLVGMIAVRGRRPFSLDDRLPDLDAYLPEGRAVCELRLLAVEKAERRSRIVAMLLEFAWRHCLREGFDLAIISGTTRQLKLYGHLGFVPFGPLVGTEEARFQPMMLTLERFAPRAAEVFRAVADRGDGCGSSFLPGPVTPSDAVRRAFEQPPQSHRSAAFVAAITRVRASLCALVGSSHGAILLGSGTSANDAVAAQLSLERGDGLIVANGEFGERLVDHARRFGLRHETIAAAWGDPLDLAAVARHVAARRPSWLWVVHVETSTGVLNDLSQIAAMCEAAGVKLCVDAISSLGNVDVDLRRAYLASGVSGKGLASMTGLAFVFHHHGIGPALVPRSLDLGLYGDEGAVPFTHSSNLVGALSAALTGVDWHARFREVDEATRWLRRRLARLGFALIASDEDAAPGAVTIALPRPLASTSVADAIAARGFLVGAYSRYLVERNWIQICPMAETSRARLADVSNALLQVCTAAAGSV